MAVLSTRNYKRTLNWIVLNGVTIVPGEIFGIDATTGYIERLTSVTTDPMRMHGIALTGGVGSGATTRIDYIPLQPNVEILLDASTTVAATDIGKNYEVTITAGVPVINLAANTNNVFHIVEAGPTTTTAWVRVIPAVNTFTTLTPT